MADGQDSRACRVHVVSQRRTKTYRAFGQLSSKQFGTTIRWPEAVLQDKACSLPLPFWLTGILNSLLQLSTGPYTTVEAPSVSERVILPKRAELVFAYTTRSVLCSKCITATVLRPGLPVSLLWSKCGRLCGSHLYTGNIQRRTSEDVLLTVQVAVLLSWLIVTQNLDSACQLAKDRRSVISTMMCRNNTTRCVEKTHLF